MVTEAPPRLFGRGIVPAAAVGREKPPTKRDTIDPGATVGKKLAPFSGLAICWGEPVTVICWLAVFSCVLLAVAVITCWRTDAVAAFQAKVYGAAVRLVRGEPSREMSTLEMAERSKASIEMLTVPQTVAPSVGESKAKVGESTPGTRISICAAAGLVLTVVTENRLA